MGRFPIKESSKHHFDERPVTTFYVTYLPGVSRMMLWRAFQPYGAIKDAYLARKKDSRGATLVLSGTRVCVM
ncbi:putative RNA-binding domain superfamily [Helianthus anomalus]